MTRLALLRTQRFLRTAPPAREAIRKILVPRMVEVLRTHEREAPLANDLLGGVDAVKFKTNFARETLKAVNSRVVSPLDKIAFANKLGASLFSRGS